jgi:hypothetical protein
MNNMTPKQFNDTFNALAQKIGSRARIEITVRNSAKSGRKVSSKFYEVTGTTTDDRELMYPITAAKFDWMLDSHPQLRELSGF